MQPKDQKLTELADFQPKQKEAWYTLMEPNTKYLLFGGAAGGGKSYLLRWAAVGLAMYYHAKFNITGVPIGLFSEDYPTLRDRQMTKIVREMPAWLGTLKETKADGLCFFLTSEYGSGKIMLRNLDDPSKYASVEFAAILVEELTKNPYETFEDLRNRMRFPGITERKFMGATNPGEIGHHWVKKLFVVPDREFPDVEQDRFRFIKSLVSDNKHNPEDYILQLKAIRNEQKRKALLEGDWNQFQGQFFGEWRDELHVCNPFIPAVGSVIVGGLDWGRVDDFAFYLTEVSRVSYDGGFFYRSKVFYEAYGNEMGPDEWSEKIVREIKRFGLTLGNVSWVRADTQLWQKQPDPKALDIYSQFVRANPGWRLLKPANKDRVGGWENLHNWLSLAPDGKPYLQFASTCKNAIATIPDLVHDDLKVEDVDPDGKNDHAGDAIRYLHMALKWVGGTVGPINHQPAATPLRPAPQFIGEKQVGINTDAFAQPNLTNTNSRVGGVSRR